MSNLKEELENFYFENKLTEVVYCQKDEQKEFQKMKKNKVPLPDDVREDDAGCFFRYMDNDLSSEEIKKLLFFRQLSYLKTIRNCLIYFVVLSVLTFIVAFIFTRFTS